VRGHARQLNDPAQLDLTPPAACLRSLQRGDQCLRLVAELLRAAPGELDLLGELGVRPGARDIGLGELLLDAGEGLAHRADELLDVEALRELAVRSAAARSRIAARSWAARARSVAVAAAVPRRLRASR